MRTSVTSGRYVCESTRGESSAQANPFMALMDRNADDEHGEVYAMSFVYSGNFYASAEGYHFGGTRMVLGVNPSTFSWKLNSGESFQTPEVVMVHSSSGIGEMTRTFHRLYRNHLMRGPWVHRDRPVLLNSWEGCYFDFTTERLLSLADSAKAEGVELFVLDDGWFGDRSDDERALGDWYVNEKKLPGGLKYLSEEIHKKGLLFGLWVEPEMVSQNSDLFREHPDWVISIPDRDPSLFRCQLVLDYSRKEVRDTVYGQIKTVLQDAEVDYVKWDMNRYLTDLGSVALEAERMQELSHRYILGVYEIQERLLSDFPNLLLENCSAGGSRFDAGMLYYSPQIWASDDSDAIERLRIQYGTSLVYPLSSMGAHISAVPNHQTGRNVPMTTRSYVALAGTFGFELDPSRISNEEREKMHGQIELYHRFSALVREGDLYRIGTVFEEQDWDAWEVVAENKCEALVTYIQVHSRPGVIRMARLIKLKGLDPERIYRVEKICDDSGNQMHDMLSAKGKETLTLSGAALMNGGVWIERMTGDYRGMLLHLVALD